VASPQAFKSQPELVHRFYNMRRAALVNVEPNAAHHALVRLEKEWPRSFLHITQNVDDLNERAGATKLLHMHGQLKKVRCVWCKVVLDWETDLDTSTPCPECGKEGKMRPDIVWFGEVPYYLEEISQALETVTIFVCIGTSGVVYPAAGFARQAASKGAKRLIEINLDDTDISTHFTEYRQGSASVEVPKLVEELLRLCLNHN
jgi:NAD-dependent deacetylase